VADTIKEAPPFADWPVDEVTEVGPAPPIELPRFANGSN
jgi:hypothetical protein